MTVDSCRVAGPHHPRGNRWRAKKATMGNLGLLLIVVAMAAAGAVDAKSRKAPGLPAPEATRLAGAWALAQARNADRLAAPPLDTPEFILDDVTLEQHRKFAEYSGDISGRWIGAAAFLAKRFPKPFAAFPEVMAGLPACQKADGHFGADQRLPSIERKRDMPILWGNGRLLIGLVEVWDNTSNPQALAMAGKLGDYFVATDKVYCNPENLRRIGGSYADGFVTCDFSCIEGLVGLARVTKVQRYLDQARHIADLAITVTDFDGLHSHGRLCAVRGFADLYALTGERRWLAAAERDWAIFRECYLLPTGGVKESLEAECDRDEGCAESDWLRLNLSLWRLTGAGRYLDAAERCLKNHFIYQQFANGGAGHRVLYQLHGQPVAFQGLSEEAWWCCGEHWARGMVDVARSAVTGSGQGLSINLAADCDSVLDGPGGTWTVTVRELPEALNVRIEAPATLKAEVRIHRPAWAAEGGVEAPKGLTARADGDTWLIQGTWRGMQELRVRLPATLRVERTSDGVGAFYCGHELMVAHPCAANAWLMEALPVLRPVVLWSEVRAGADGKVVIPASLTPNADPDQPEQWRLLELASLRSEAAAPDHQRAWFSFQPRAAKPGQVAALVAKLRFSWTRH